MENKLNILLTGPTGRMGKSLVAAIEKTPEIYFLHGLIARKNAPMPSDLSAEHQKKFGHQFDHMALGADVLIDFTLPEGTMAYIAHCVSHNIPIVVGTTGFSEQQFAQLTKAAQSIPVLYAANMSIGINVLRHVLTRVSPLLSADFDIEMLETHHRDKRDAPSGTALDLGRAIADSIGVDLKHSAVYDRSSSHQSRPDHVIGFSAIRGGDVIGEHRVLFLGEGERLSFEHQATDRSLFAKGALFAAKWLVQEGVKRGPGLYGMDDVLSLKW